MTHPIVFVNWTYEYNLPIVRIVADILSASSYWNPTTVSKGYSSFGNDVLNIKLIISLNDQMLLVYPVDIE